MVNYVEKSFLLDSLPFVILLDIARYYRLCLASLGVSPYADPQASTRTNLGNNRYGLVSCMVRNHDITQVL